MPPDAAPPTCPVRHRWLRLPLAVAVVATLLLAVCTFATTSIAGERAARSVERQLRVQELTGEVRWFDELLTMATNMAAATGDGCWKDRYDAHVGRLDEAIAALRALSPELFDREMGSETEAANRRLVALEAQAFGLVAAGRAPAARALLHGDDYASAKAVYADGNRRVQEALADLVQRERDDARTFGGLLVAATLCFTVLASAAWVVLARRAREQRAAHELAVALAHSRAAEEANRTKSQFVANISHELRTPMTAILGYAELLADPGCPEAQRADACTTVLRNGEHLLQVINDLLDMSKIEAGTVTVEQVPTDPALIVEDVLSLVRVRAQQQGIDLQRTWATAVPRRIACDPMRLRQVLVNLVGNAVKFTVAGQVHVRVGHDPAAGRLWFAVEDTGIGMTAAQVDRLFQAFVQADETTERRFGGTGLGLAISRRYAQLLGGDIEVQSTPGAGSVFTLWLPSGPIEPADLWQPDDDELAGQRAARGGSGTRPTATLEAARILLAEDGRDNQRLVAHHLQKAGAEVIAVDNGRQAVDALERGGTAFDLVLMDMQMPELDGYRATRMLRDRGWAVPIVALTANAMSTDRDRCLRAGCDDYLTKPIDRGELLATCARWTALRTTVAAAT